MPTLRVCSHELTCERLDLRPADCLYVSGRGGRELSGARQVGMDIALLCDPAEVLRLIASDPAVSVP